MDRRLPELHRRHRRDVRWPARAPPGARHHDGLGLARAAPKLEDYKARKGWSIPWYSSFGSDFNYDFHVTLDESKGSTEYNFRALRRRTGITAAELPGQSHFLRDGDRIFHTNSVYARGLEGTGGSYYFLDQTALGRQEEWEEPKGRSDLARANQPDFATS